MAAELMTKDDLMAYLKISRPTVNRLMKEDGLPYIKLGHHVRFKQADVDAYLESKIIKKKPSPKVRPR